MTAISALLSATTQSNVTISSTHIFSHFFFFCFVSFFEARFSQCDPGWPQACLPLKLKSFLIGCEGYTTKPTSSFSSFPFLSVFFFFFFILHLFRYIQNVNRAAALSFRVCFWRRCCCIRYCLFVCFAISR